MRAEAQHLRTVARYVTDERVVSEIDKMVEELERRARELEQATGGFELQPDRRP